MGRRLLTAVLVTLLLGTAGIARADDEGGPMADSATLRGTVSLTQTGRLPDGSVLTVALEDMSRADAPAVTLAETRIDLTGQQPPIPFAMDYPTAVLDPRTVYSVRARVTLGERLLFVTTETSPVDVLNPAPAALVLDPVSAPADVSLTDTYWKLVEVDGTPIEVQQQMREPHLVLNGADGRFAGSGGVNRLMGGYTLDGATLMFGQAASTMMAGPPEAMATEQLIVAALQRVRTFGVAGDRLTLLDDDGTPVIRAVAVALN